MKQLRLSTLLPPSIIRYFNREEASGQPMQAHHRCPKTYLIKTHNKIDKMIKRQTTLNHIRITLFPRRKNARFLHLIMTEFERKIDAVMGKITIHKTPANSKIEICPNIKAGPTVKETFQRKSDTIMKKFGAEKTLANQKKSIHRSINIIEEKVEPINREKRRPRLLQRLKILFAVSPPKSRRLRRNRGPANLQNMIRMKLFLSHLILRPNRKKIPVK